MITISRFSYYLLICADWALILYTAYITHLLWKAKMDKITTKKFKKICKWEFRDPIRQEHVIIKEFIERYTQEHKIDWDEHI